MKANDINNKLNVNAQDIRELSIEEMEDVTGGGIREIVAATTLAAMAMTGNTVSAFGLASAMAENTAHVEEAPAQEPYGAEYEGTMEAEIDEVVEVDAVDVDAPVQEIEATLGEVEAPYEEVLAEGEGTIIMDEPSAMDETPVAEETPATDETPAEAPAIDMEVLEQIVNDTIDAYMEEGQQAVIDALRANLGDAVPNELLTEVVGRMLAERYDEVPSAEAISEAMKANAPAEDAQVEETAQAEPESEDAQTEAAEEPAEDVIEAENVEGLTEAEAEVEADLSELYGEAVGATEDDPETRRQQMEEMINDAVASHQSEGIYAALDASFAALAENAVALANPETGVIETEGNQIINMTYDAVAANFDNPPEQLMGAIGAAAWRADEAGYIQRLGGDPALVSMAAAESVKGYAEVTKLAKTSYDSTLDAIALICPGFKPLVPLLKALGAEVFSTGGNPNAAVLKKLDEIEAQLQAAEDSIKHNTYNVVSLQPIGDKYSVVADKAEHVQERIGNIMGNPALTEAEKLQRVADLLDNSEFEALESAMDGATRCFTSNVNDIFERQSIFEAAYARACESVMFSQEALMISMPYIVRQYAVYAAAYGVMNQVYNAYEQVYGAGSLTETRRKMAARMGSIDLSGNPIDGAVGQQIKAYFSRDRYTFVNRGATNIRLKRGIIASHIANEKRYDAHYSIDGQIQGIPLNAQQTEALCSYAASRRESLFDYLFNDMGFVPVNAPSVDVDRFFPEANPDQWNNVQGSKQSGGLHKKATAASVTRYDRVNGRWQRTSGRVAMVNGRQTLDSYLNHSNRNRYIKCNLLNATDVGVNKSDMESIFVDYDYSNKWIGYGNLDMLILQGR